MKKRVIISFMLLFALAVSAQNSRIIDRNLTFSGDLVGLTKSHNPKEDDFIKYNDGRKWFLKNVRVGDENHIRFWIETPDGMSIEYQTWSGHMACIMFFKNSDGNQCYNVFDDTFVYLMIVEIGEGKYIAKLCTDERIKETKE